MQPVNIIFVRMGVDSFFIKRNEIKVYSSCKTILSMHGIYCIKGTAMEITAAPINDRLRVSKVSCKFPIPTIYNFGVIDP